MKIRKCCNPTNLSWGIDFLNFVVCEAVGRHAFPSLHSDPFALAVGGHKPISNQSGFLFIGDFFAPCCGIGAVVE
jgi:hypothetical protein